jgi:N6-adenosine-specific RNA methylase IME4
MWRVDPEGTPRPEEHGVPSTPFQVLPPLAPADFASLRASIEARGVLTPIVVDERGRILDGHNRAEIAKALGIDCPRVVRDDLTDSRDKRLFAVEVNLTRCQLTDAQRVLVGMDLEPDVAAEAKARQRAGVAQEATARTDDEDARRVGIGSGATYRRDKAWMAQATAEMVEKARSGAVPMSKVRANVKALHADAERRRIAEESHAPRLKTITERFRVIYVDPPWEVADVPYPTKPLDEIKRVGKVIPADDNCALFMWATAPMMDDAIDVLRAWGFEYRNSMIWDKQSPQPGNPILGQHEILLFGVRGTLPQTPARARPASVYSEARTAHSAKPESFYEIIEGLYPGLRYLEMYARDRGRPDWVVWGNQAIDDAVKAVEGAEIKAAAQPAPLSKRDQALLAQVEERMRGEDGGLADTTDDEVRALGKARALEMAGNRA